MARVTVEDCITFVPNRFELVILAAKRARQLSRGSEPLLATERDKFTVLALREIGEGLLDIEALRLQEEVQNEPQEELDDLGMEARAIMDEDSHIAGVQLDEFSDLDAANDGEEGGEEEGMVAASLDEIDLSISMDDALD